MKTLKFENQESWLEARRTKITGSRLKEVITLKGTGKKMGYYELIAERLAIPATDQNPMDRGHELESVAIERFEKETGKAVNKELLLWVREDNDSIAVSPDGVIGETEAVEVKCLSSARHIESYLNNAPPEEFRFQVLQYFIVNDKLERLYFVMFDPRLSAKDFFYFTIERKDKEEEITRYLECENAIIQEINSIVNQLTF